MLHAGTGVGVEEVKVEKVMDLMDHSKPATSKEATNPIKQLASKSTAMWVCPWVAGGASRGGGGGVGKPLASGCQTLSGPDQLLLQKQIHLQVSKFMVATTDLSSVQYADVECWYELLQDGISCFSSKDKVLSLGYSHLQSCCCNRL